MRWEIVATFAVLGGALVLFVTEKVRRDLVALLVLGALGVSGIVPPAEALAGFSHPAVVTVWAMFVLGEGLRRTGVTELVGVQVLRLSGRSEARAIAVVMLTSGLLSGIMNNIGVAAFMLPVVMDVARRAGHAPSRLLMPLAYGSLMGGLTTLVGTPPNLLVSAALRERGLAPFQLFDFTPLGLAVLLAGTLFVTFVGRHLLPVRDPAKETAGRGDPDLGAQYALSERTFLVRVPLDSPLAGRTLAESRIGAAAGLLVVGVLRDGRAQLLPEPGERLRGGDRLLVQGKLDRWEDLRDWSEVEIEREAPELADQVLGRLRVASARLAARSSFVGRTLRQASLRSELGVHVLAVRQGGELRHEELGSLALAAGDELAMLGEPERLASLEATGHFEALRETSWAEAAREQGLEERYFLLRIPESSHLAGKTLEKSRLGEAFDFRVLGALRGGEVQLGGPELEIRAEDRLLVQGLRSQLDTLRGLQRLELEREAGPGLAVLESERFTLMECTLAPRSALAGKSLADLRFRDRYGLQALAIWREGRAIRSELARLPLRLGDALLLFGPREKLMQLGRDPDFLVLTQIAQEPARRRLAPVSLAILVAVVAAVLSGALPISVAAVAGAALMALTRCLTMDEAYRAIDWRAIFLIAGMLPLGTALESSGAAALLAGGVASVLGPLGPLAFVAGIYLSTAVAATVLPTAALAVIYAPVVLESCAEAGVAPHAAMLALAAAAATSFSSPISHPANVLVMGPGGYRFADYLKLGAPLALVVLLVVVAVLPLFWPLAA